MRVTLPTWLGQRLIRPLAEPGANPIVHR